MKVGDPVIVLQGDSNIVGSSHTIIEIRTGKCYVRNSTEPNLIYVLSNNRKYYYDHLKLDIQAIRANKINSIFQ